MFYAERIDDYRIVEKGVFLSIGEFVPYRIKGWSGTKETNRAADAAIMALGDEQDSWWMRECSAYCADGGMSSPATRHALAFHMCD